MAVVRPFCVWGDAALDGVRQRAQEAVDIWARNWLPGTHQVHPTVQVTALAGGRAPLPDLDYEGLRGALSTLWVRTRASDQWACGHAVVGAELAPGGVPVDDWVAETLERAWSARNHGLCKALLGVTELDAAALPKPGELAALAAAGSGALQISCETLGLQVLVDGSAMRDLPPVEHGSAHRLPPSVGIERAMGPAKLQVEVLLGRVELDLEQVLDIRCGDILRLPRRLDEALTLCCAGQPLAEARLGVAGGRKAVQVFTHHDEETKESPQ